MLNLPEVDLKRRTRFYLDAVAEGQQTEAATLILRQLRRRLGLLDAAREAQIQSLSISELEALGEVLLDFHSAAELIPNATKIMYYRSI